MNKQADKIKLPLWTRNFLLCFIGAIISAVGGIGLNTAFSMLIYDQTQSTLLSSVFFAVSMIPNFLLPLIMGPIIDRNNPLKIMVRNELMLACLFFIAAAYSYFFGFAYIPFMLFTIIISSFGVISSLASNSIIPQLMHKSNYMRGNSIMGIIYPACNILVAPAAIILFDKYGIEPILAFYGVCCIIDATLESRINAEFEFIESEKFSIKQYVGDLKEGFAFFKNDIAIRTVFVYFTIVMLVSTVDMLIYPFFENSAVLTKTDYGILSAVRGAGYMLGGLFHYLVKIPDKRRYAVAATVYILFATIDAPLFFMPFWLMCLTRFVLGLMGMNSANIRLSAVQNRVPNTMRAKINSFFDVMVTGAIMIGQLTVGTLGEFFPYWSIYLCFNAIYLISTLIFILPKKNMVRELYNYDTSNMLPPDAVG